MTAPAAAPARPPDVLSGLADLAAHLQVLAREAEYAARDGHEDDFSVVAERMLREHVRWAEAYRSWLARTRRSPGPERMTT